MSELQTARRVRAVYEPPVCTREKATCDMAHFPGMKKLFKFAMKE